MASERQIAANRRNAQKSTGPRSVSGKKRSSKNSYRHGLAVPISRAEIDVQIKELVLQFTGESNGAEARAMADAAARAQLELSRAKRVQTEMIERSLDRAIQCGQYEKPHGVKHPKPKGADPVLHEAEEERRLAEAIQNILPDLAKTDRYTRRATGQRNRAFRGLARAAKSQR